MALTGLNIQKLLPKTNCKECGSNTCLAFAMKLAAKKADLSECPYASEEAKRILGAESEPPVKTVCFGELKELRAGDETVLYRHEKTFVNQTLLAININDQDTEGHIEDTLNKIRDYRLERVGEVLTVDMVSINQTGSDDEAFAKLARTAWEVTKRPLILRSGRIGALSLAAAAIKGTNGVIASSDNDNHEKLLDIARENGHSLCISAEDLDSLATLSDKIMKTGFTSLVLQFKTYSMLEQFQTNTISRRAAIKDNYEPLGFPFIRFIDNKNIMDSTVEAINEICKYGGICVLPEFDAAQLSSLMTLRLNIFTDPQKPIQVEPKLYPVGEPRTDSPVFVTTNFSLTYFIVSGEIENSGISAWLVVPECEGMSVLTAWAAGKFSGSHIAKFIKESNIEEQITSRQIIIPGYVSQISGELEESLPGWKVVVGPQEAGDMESFVKARLS